MVPGNTDTPGTLGTGPAAPCAALASVHWWDAIGSQSALAEAMQRGQWLRAGHIWWEMVATHAPGASNDAMQLILAALTATVPEAPLGKMSNSAPQIPAEKPS